MTHAMEVSYMLRQQSPENCDFALDSAGFWTCRTCGYTLPVPLPEPPRRNCPRKAKHQKPPPEPPPDLTEAAGRLGIKPRHVAHYAAALARWSAAGFPVRDQAEVDRIFRDHCQPCPHFVKGRCRKCGCRATRGKMGMTNKLKMRTETCPDGKWK